MRKNNLAMQKTFNTSILVKASRSRHGTLELFINLSRNYCSLIFPVTIDLRYSRAALNGISSARRVPFRSYLERSKLFRILGRIRRISRSKTRVLYFRRTLELVHSSSLRRFYGLASNESQVIWILVNSNRFVQHVFIVLRILTD